MSSFVLNSLPYATKLRQGNIFTSVSRILSRGGLPQCMLGYTPSPRQTLPLGRHSPGADPARQTLPWHVHPLGRYTTPCTGTPPGRCTPWTGTPPGRHTPHDRRYASYWNALSFRLFLKNYLVLD